MQTNRFLRRARPALLAVLLALLGVTPASAQWVVFDPANFTQSVINAYRTLQSNINQATQIANQIDQIDNQVRVLENQGLNLASLPESLVSSYRSNMANLMDSVRSIRGLEHSLSDMRDRYQAMYPSTYASDAAWQNLNSYLLKWNLADRNNMQDALQTGSSVLNSLPATQADIARLGQDSASAKGALSAMQAGNQLSMNIAGQLAGLNAQTATYQQAMLQHMSASASMSAAAEAANKAALMGFSDGAKPAWQGKPQPSPESYAPWAH
ncbi:P-type conjugative transfer protein TrbJ [Dyella sp. A6]|uniref:P-type conjugative transfer protein TrbJ n=1 Tax=Dyella aluminiiresistens TaxID=3069105 RepID=UPI002E779924|nr:P-type conjugative transfer protein TrbJ [Dyella sp. A6]